jgi:hypothetical protein
MRSDKCVRKIKHLSDGFDSGATAFHDFPDRWRTRNHWSSIEMTELPCDVLVAESIDASVVLFAIRVFT